MRLVLVALLALTVSCGSAKVGGTPSYGDTRTPADSSGSGDAVPGDPVAGDPIAGDPLTGDPLPGDSLAGDPLAGDPLAGDPLAGDPLAGDPLAGDPLAGDPLAGDPLAGDPLAGDPYIVPGDFLGCTADGPHVSNTTCVASNQCGSVERPWCTIQAAIDNAASNPILVAGHSGRPYTEAITMADGVDVEGGWNTGFTSRDSDPSTNGAVIRATTAVRWPASTTATLDGFTITDSLSSDPSGVSSVTGDATAGITLNNVAIRQANSVTDSALGVGVGGTGAGTLTLTHCSLDIVDAGLSSFGVLTGPDFNGAVVLTDTTVFAGAATATGAVRLTGVDTLTVTNGQYDGGDGTTASLGIQVADSAEVTLTDVTVNGGRGDNAVAVDLAVNTDTIVDGGTITGGGLPGGNTAAGIRTEGQLSIVGAVIVGADPGSTSISPMANGIGVELGGAADAIILTTIQNATIEGGHLATTRIGILADTAMLDLQSSTVAGSTTSGGTNVFGVSLTGFVNSATHTISGNSITGGAPRSSNGGVYRAVALYSNSAIPTSISGNSLVQGCAPACDGPGATATNLSAGGGIYISTGTGHVVENNDLILGGPHTGATANTSHAGITGGFAPSIGTGALIEIDITGNTLIAGNTDATNQPANAVGVQGRDVDVLVDSNVEIRGGFAIDNATGVATVRRTSGSNILELRDNDLFGGAATQTMGVALQDTSLTATDNLIDACGLPPSNPSNPPGACVNGTSSDGLAIDGTTAALVANNFIFGGYADSSDGCVITPAAVSPGTGGILMAYNLCLGLSHASTSGGTPTRAEGLTIEGGTQNGYVFLNNIIGAGSDAVVRLGVRESDVVTGITFENNDILPDSFGDTGVALYTTEGGTELDTAAAVNALNGGPLAYASNISVDPLFAAPNVYAPSAAGFHLNPNCILHDLAQVVTRVDVDFDNEPRGDGSSTFPEIGPDECDP